MKAALYQDKSSTNMRSGDVLVYWKENKMISVLRRGQFLLWEGRDNKRILSCLRNEDDFNVFASTLGMVLGLNITPKMTSFGPAFVFRTFSQCKQVGG